ncbi:MAG: NAD(P)H-hydrate dehydratase [Magnetococcus sp. DMHC-6]
MARLLTSAWMQEADRRTIEELGIPGVVLMENAGAGVVEILWHKIPKLTQKRVLILAGRGNNGGDGFVIARRLLQAGVNVQVLLFAQSAQIRGDALIHQRVFTNLGGPLHEITTSDSIPKLIDALRHTDIVIDAIFGTGLSKPITGLLAEAFTLVNQAKKPLLAVDIPSGVSADSGHILGCALQANWTVTFAAEKIGHRQYPGAQMCGEMILVPIGIPCHYIERSEHWVLRNLPDDLVIPPTPTDAHKGTFGHLLIVAGGTGKAGAALLTTQGALRMGPGLVTVASPASIQPQVAAQLIEAMTYPLPEDPLGGLHGLTTVQALQKSGIKPQAMAMGPGLGMAEGTGMALESLLTLFDLPTVLDADALNFLAAKGEMELTKWARDRHTPLILTPHPGEMGRLMNCPIQKIQQNRLETTVEAAAKWGVWVVLKGAGTVIASPEGVAWINDTGNPCLASGGSGDLLCGMIAGLLTRGWPVASAVRGGVWLHGAAADAAAKKLGQIGLVASDLLPYLLRLRQRLG